MTATDNIDIDELLTRVDERIRQFDGDRAAWEAKQAAAEKRAAQYRELAPRGPDDAAGWLIAGMVAPYRKWAVTPGRKEATALAAGSTRAASAARSGSAFRSCGITTTRRSSAKRSTSRVVTTVST
jgi:hypothetical protein